MSAIEHIIEKHTASGEINTQEIEQIVDFMRSYADQGHHGKRKKTCYFLP